MHRNGLRLVYSSAEDLCMTRRRAQKEKARVYPATVVCFQCRKRFNTREEVEDVVNNDGACTPCAERLDSFPAGSEKERKHG